MQYEYIDIKAINDLKFIAKALKLKILTFQ